MNFIASERCRCEDCKSLFSGGQVTYKLEHGKSICECPYCKSEKIKVIGKNEDIVC